MKKVKAGYPFDQGSRSISAAGLKASLRWLLHPQSINPIVYGILPSAPPVAWQSGGWVPRFGDGFALRCLQRLSAMA